MKNKLFIASDHAGYNLKECIKIFLSNSFLTIDLGPENTKSCDYPIYANKLTDAVLLNNCFGILICGSGIGMTIAANRKNGIRAANCWSVETARLSREHNDANVLVLGARLIEESLAKDIVSTFLQTSANDEEKYVRRNLLLDK